MSLLSFPVPPDLCPAVDDGGSEPPLKRARSSSAGLDNSVDGSGFDGRDESAGGGDWRGGDDRESRDAALNAELARYMIRTEPLGMDRHHNRYWYMHVSVAVVGGLGLGPEWSFVWFLLPY
jgi:hypothetical protein